MEQSLGRQLARPRVVGAVRPVLVVLGLGALFRFLLAYVLFPGQGLTGDLRLFGEWAQTLAAAGPGSFYRTAQSANYPPLYLYVLWLVGELGRVLAPAAGTTAAAATLALLKLPAMLADLAIGALLYRAAARWWGGRAGLVAAALYLFIPVTWYDSALWGQVDAVLALVMLASVLLLIDGWSEAAAATAVLAVLVKPQGLVAPVIVAPVLVRRHVLPALLRRWRHVPPGPVPEPRGPVARLDAALGGWPTLQQGPERLVSSALAGLVALVVPLVPFDLPALAPAQLSDVPVLGHIAGLVSLISSAAGEFSVLTANAFNAWALAGADPLAATVGTSGTQRWIADSTPIIGGLPASLVGTALVGAVALVVAIGLLLRDGRMPILVAFTVMAFAFYALPTRVHERYLFPAFTTGALLAAASLAWSGWYVALGLLNAVNIHAVLTTTQRGFGAFPGGVGRAGGDLGGGFAGGGFGGAGFGPQVSAIQLPFGDLSRAEPVVVAVAVGQTLLLLVLLAAWARTIAAAPHKRGPAEAAAPA